MITFMKLLKEWVDDTLAIISPEHHLQFFALGHAACHSWICKQNQRTTNDQWYLLVLKSITKHFK